MTQTINNFAKYRAIRFGEKRPSTEGTFSSPDAIMNYIKERGLDDPGAYRVERLHDDRWIFVSNKTL